MSAIHDELSSTVEEFRAAEEVLRQLSDNAQRLVSAAAVAEGARDAVGRAEASLTSTATQLAKVANALSGTAAQLAACAVGLAAVNPKSIEDALTAQHTLLRQLILVAGVGVVLAVVALVIVLIG